MRQTNKSILKQRVLDHFRLYGNGKSGACTSKRIAWEAGFEGHEREVRHVIRELIFDGWPIASSVDERPGFFLIETKDEADYYIESLKSRIRQDALRLRDFKVAARDIRQPEQLVLI